MRRARFIAAVAAPSTGAMGVVASANAGGVTPNSWKLTAERASYLHLSRHDRVRNPARCATARALEPGALVPDGRAISCVALGGPQ